MVKNTALFLSLFSIIFACFFFSHGWYPKTELTIEGSGESDAVITVRWDSGKGFNSYEEERFSFLPFPGHREKMVDIVVEGGVEKHKDSLGSKVILSELRIDDSGVNIPEEALRDVRHVPGQGWYLTSEKSRISLERPVEKQLSFSFKTAINAGTAAISINGVQSSHDLFRRNWEILFSDIRFWLLDEHGNFSLTMHLPRYRIERLEVSGTGTTAISSVAVTTDAISLSPAYEQTSTGTIAVVEPNRSLKRLFHPTHLLYQLVSALLMTLILWQMFTSAGNVGGVRQLFIDKRRWPFWLFLVGGIAVYGFWLLAFWPGVMSVDSLNIWRAAQLPEVMINNHPFLNELWYFFLSLFWQNIAIVPVLQIVLLTTLIGATFFSAVARGVSGWLVVPCYLLLLFSVPVGLYTTTLWKDIPFALLVILWALVPVYLFDKKRAGERVTISFIGMCLLLVSFLSLLLFRHNGLIYLFVIPLLFLLLGLIRLPRSAAIAGCVAGAGLIYLVVYPPIFLKSGSYFHDLSRTYLRQIETESLSQRAIDAATAYPRLLDIKKNQESSDFWHYYLNDRYSYEFLKEVGWSDVYPYLPKDEVAFPELHRTGLQIYRASLEYPWLYLSWYPFYFLYLFPLTILLFRWFPRAAVFSTVILAQAVALLLFVGTVNWRYYYFVLLGGYFLLPILLVDIHNLRQQRFSAET